MFEDFPGALSLFDVCVLLCVLCLRQCCGVHTVVMPCCVSPLIKEALSSLHAGISEIASQAGLFVAQLSQDSYKTAD